MMMSWCRTWSLQAEVEGKQLENFKGSSREASFFVKEGNPYQPQLLGIELKGLLYNSERQSIINKQSTC